jgi:nucleoside-diphosphate-sugar epimerase
MLISFRNFSYTDVHVDGTERIAEAVAKYDVDRFIHVSSYNANKNSPSEFFSTKVCLCWTYLEPRLIVPGMG